MKELEWLSERDFIVDGVRFECSIDDYTRETSQDRLVLLKGRGMLEQYADVFARAIPTNILEFGIFQGGSPALFAAWFDAEKIVGIDICKPVQAFDEFCRTHPIGNRIRAYYGVSQIDRARIEEILAAEFGPTPIDLIIDDASHQYELTRQTFEIAFPLLRPGGTYLIEDWGWAHWPNSARFNSAFGGQTTLSMLTMELLMLCASRSDIVSEVRVFPGFAVVRKSFDAKVLPDFMLSDFYQKGAIELVGTQHLHLGGVARLIAARVHRRLQRTARKFSKTMGFDTTAK